MEIRIQRIFLKMTTKSLTIFLACCLVFSVSAADDENADQEQAKDDVSTIFDPKVVRREVKREAIDNENWELGVYSGVISIEDFGVNQLTGARVAYHVTEDFFIEASYAESEAGLSSFERLNGNVVLLPVGSDQRKYSQYNIGLGFNILPGEGFIGENLAFTSSLYLLTALGSTEFAGEHRSTIMIGGGYRVLLTDWFALHLTLKEHLYDIELIGNSKTAHDLEISSTISFFF